MSLFCSMQMKVGVAYEPMPVPLVDIDEADLHSIVITGGDGMLILLCFGQLVV